jgi:polygalacturonase
VLATGVDNVTLDNLLIDTEGDGFDIDCYRSVRVSDCTVNSPWDDAICLKSCYSLGYLPSTDTITIANCFVIGIYEIGSVIAGTWKTLAEINRVRRNGRVKLGTESNGGFRNRTISNFICDGSDGWISSLTGQGM